MSLKIRSLAQYRGQKCLNCEVPLDHEDKFCHQCGQLNSTKKLALKDFFTEFISNIFSYDSRGWRTIKHILFKPGFVTKQYLHGKRTNYANPFRFFLSVCIVFFLMIQVTQTYKKFHDDDLEDKVSSNDSLNTDTKNLKINLSNGNGIIATVENPDEIDITDEQLEEIEKNQLGGTFIANKIREERDLENRTSTKDSTLIKQPKTYFTQKELDEKHWLFRTFEQINDYTDYYRREREPDTEIALQDLNHQQSNYNKVLYERAIVLESIANDGNKLVDIILPKLPLFLFLFTPFITLFLWLLYARRSFNYMEHLIFLFNVMTFVFLSNIILLMIDWISIGTVDLIAIFFWLIGPFYLYKSLRNFYGQGRIKTFIKFLLISFVYTILFMIGLVVLLFIGIAID
jgi:hypothetical protein